MFAYYERRSFLTMVYEYYCGIIGKLYGELYDKCSNVSKTNKRIERFTKKAKRAKSRIRSLDRKFLDSL